MIGFYVLAVALTAGLLYIPYAEYVYLHRVDARIGIACLGAACAILIGILPRIDRFPAPGVELLPASQPRLFTVLDAIAAATSQTRPKSVYLIGDLNAWVSQRGGIMGIGSRRVMAIGLPLLETMTIGELRGIVAHEYGHYHGGDTALGPWIYKTRAAIERTLHRLAGHSALIQKPFVLYGNAFLRVTLAISRRQEYAADALAARIVGSEAMASGLATLHRSAPAFGTYWRTEIGPALAAGFRPPVAAGFRDFLSQPPIEEATSRAFQHEMENGKADPYDSHPALRERLAALSALGTLPAPADASAESDRAPALSLLDGLEGLEAALTKTLAPKESANKLVAIAWPSVGERVWIPQWQRAAKAKAARLRGLTLGMLSDPTFDYERLAVDMGIRSPDKGVRARQLGATLGASVVVALHARGWVLDAMPGRKVTLEKDGVTLAPFFAIEQLVNGAMPPEAWREWVAQTGLGETDFSAMV